MNYVVMIVLGGTGSISGAVLGGIAITLLPELLKPVRDQIYFTDEYLQVIYALALVLMMILRPAGVFGKGEISLAWLPWFRRRDEVRGPVDAADAGLPAEPVHRKAVQAGQPGDLVLAAHGLTKRFGGLTAVGDVSVEMHDGELVGLIGPNGAGKTTVFNLFTGVYEPSDGTIAFLGKALAGAVPNPAARRALVLIGDLASRSLADM